MLSGLWGLALQMHGTDPTEVGHTVEMEAGALRAPPVAPHRPAQPADNRSKLFQCQGWVKTLISIVQFKLLHFFLKIP